MGGVVTYFGAINYVTEVSKSIINNYWLLASSLSDVGTFYSKGLASPKTQPSACLNSHACRRAHPVRIIPDSRTNKAIHLRFLLGTALLASPNLVHTHHPSIIQEALLYARTRPVVSSSAAATARTHRRAHSTRRLRPWPLATDRAA
jgi:hypothetical protein